MMTQMFRAFLARQATRISWPIRLLHGNLPKLDRLLKKELTPAQVNAVARGCREGGERFGAYYHWKFRQIALLATMSTLDRDQAIALVTKNDHSDYRPIDGALADSRGLLITIPHHGFYLPGIIAMSERLQAQRDVFVFYESPENHDTNAIFDMIHERVFGNGISKVSILYNNRIGLVRAIRELRKGNVVFILPDVAKRVQDTYRMPFCGMQRDFMLGSATIARRSNARLMPVVSQPGKALFGFSNLFADIVEPCATDGTAEGDLHADYRTTLAVMRGLEPLMTHHLVFWQYIHSYVAVEKEMEKVPTFDTISTELLLKDPYLNLLSSSPISV